MTRALTAALLLACTFPSQAGDPQITTEANLRESAAALAELRLASDPARKKALAAVALAAASSARNLSPQDSRTRLALAIASGEAARLEPPTRQLSLARQIHDEAEAAISLDPSNSEAWFVLGRWNYEVANLNPLLRNLAKLAGLPPASNERAVACFSTTISLGPARVSKHIELGRALAAVGKPRQAIAEIQKGLSMESLDTDDIAAKARGRITLASLSQAPR